MDSNHQHWNEQQKELRRVLLSHKQHEQAMTLFLAQHAIVHSAKITPDAPCSFEDELLDDMSEAHIRRIPEGSNVSVAWHIWHLARIEDITMSVLLGGRPQLFIRGQWQERLKSPAVDTGNTMDKAEATALSQALDIAALRDYRLAVGRETRDIVPHLEPEAFKQKVNPARLQQLLDEGAVLEGAREIITYWSRRTLAELLLMPPTRHNLVHLNKAQRLKAKRQ